MMTKRKEEAFDPERYSVLIKKELVDGEWMFVARVRELPDVVVYEPTHEAAHRGVLDVIADLHDLALEQGSPFPEPEAPAEFSGRVTLRMPKWLHRDLSMAAEREAVSINQYMVTVLAKGAAIISARVETPMQVYYTTGMGTPFFDIQIPTSGMLPIALRSDVEHAHFGVIPIGSLQ